GVGGRLQARLSPRRYRVSARVGDLGRRAPAGNDGLAHTYDRELATFSADFAALARSHHEDLVRRAVAEAQAERSANRPLHLGDRKETGCRCRRNGPRTLSPSSPPKSPTGAPTKRSSSAPSAGSRPTAKPPKGSISIFPPRGRTDSKTSGLRARMNSTPSRCAASFCSHSLRCTVRSWCTIWAARSM